jgi:sortase A
VKKMFETVRRLIVPPLKVLNETLSWITRRSRSVSQPQLRSRAAVAALVVVLGLSGVVLVGQGLYIFAKAQVAQVLLNRAFTEAIATGRSVKPWSWADTWPVARVEVPRLKESRIVLAGASGQALAFGPGHVPNTAQPGSSGTAVIAAHRDTHFSFVGELINGDEIRVTRIDGKSFRFTVSNTKIVPWNKSGIIANAEGRNLVLSTCWPLNAKIPGTLRYLVFAEAISE